MNNLNNVLSAIERATGYRNLKIGKVTDRNSWVVYYSYTDKNEKWHPDYVAKINSSGRIYIQKMNNMPMKDIDIDINQLPKQSSKEKNNDNGNTNAQPEQLAF